MQFAASPVEVTIERRVEWPDTDASGHYHHSAVIRWVEDAEAALLDKHGLVDLFGVAPRVHYEVDYRERLWFHDMVTVTLKVTDLGRTSLRYEFVVRRGETLAARGTMVVVHSDPGKAGTIPWPEHIRDRLDPSRQPGDEPPG